MALEIDAGDVVKLILQFCKENNLTDTMTALQNETRISLNTVDNVEMFVADIESGHWDAVLKAAATLSLPEAKLFDLYEQVVLELMELRESDTAHAILRLSKPMQAMMREDPTRYRRLEALQNRTYFDPREAYPDGSTKEKRRAAIAQALVAEVSVVPPSRLMALIGQSLKWQRLTGSLPPGTEFDVFRGTAAQQQVEEEAHPRTRQHNYKFGTSSHPEAAVFSPDGQHLVTGSADGFIEVFDPYSGQLNTELKYQSEDALMMHDTTITCLNFSLDSEILASGSVDGKLKAWKLRTGQCLRRFDNAHSQGVSCVAFTRDGTQILSGSYDCTIRLHGLKSGRMLKEFREHTAFVHSAYFSFDNSTIVSGSADGTVKVWDVRNAECVNTFGVPGVDANTEVSVHTVLPIPDNADQLLVVNRSPTIHIVTTTGKPVKAMTSGKTVDFVAATLSPRGEWAYCVGEDGVLYSFNLSTGKLVHMMRVHERAVGGVVHHPHRNLLATYSEDGTMKTWKP